MIEGELMGKLESERSDGRRRGGREGWARRYFCCFSFPNPASKRPEKIGGYVRYWQSFFSTGIMFGMRYVPFWMTSPRERSLWFSRFPALRIGDGSIAIASGRYSFRFGSVKLDFPRIFGLKHFCQAFWKIVMSNTVSFYPIDALNFILSLFLFFSLVLLSFFFHEVLRGCVTLRGILARAMKRDFDEFQSMKWFFFPEWIICICINIFWENIKIYFINYFYKYWFE